MAAKKPKVQWDPKFLASVTAQDKGPGGTAVNPVHWDPAFLAQVTAQDKGPGGTLASAAPPPVAPQPFDPAFEAQKLGAQWNISTGNAEATYQTGQTAYGSGYNADGSSNTANPYSQATELQNSYKRAQAGTANSGRLYSGSRVNAQARNDRGYAQQSDALKRSTADRYHGIGVNQLSNYGQNATGVTGADYESLRKSIYG